MKQVASLLYFIHFYDSVVFNQYARIEDNNMRASKIPFYKVESTTHGTSLLDKIFPGFLIFVKIYEGKINQKN